MQTVSDQALYLFAIPLYNIVNEVSVMMKQHLIALDLDGTLLTDKKEISPQSIRVLQKAVEDGHIVVIATGRSHRSSIHYYHMLKLTTAMVNFNGAFVHHPKDKKWSVFHNPLPKSTVLNVIDACSQLEVQNILVESHQDIFINKHDQNIIDFLRVQNDDPFLKIGNIKDVLQEDPTLMLIYPKEEQVQELNNIFNQFHAEVLHYRNWGAPSHMIEIVKKGINKAIGLQRIAQYYNIPKERIIAFGDEDNDLEMIEYAGVGVAMQNGIQELKSIADYVTSTNEEDGVSQFLKGYLKIS